MKKLIEQICRFGIVGVVCFFIDYGVLYMLTEFAKIPYLVSSAISFSVSVIVNYILSMKYVFNSKKNINKAGEFSVFVILSIFGLGLNEIIMWLCVEKISIYYMAAKIISTILVMIYNFITRKIFLEEKNQI